MRSVQRLAKLVVSLQPVALLALVIAHDFACPLFGYRHIPYEQVSPHALGYDCRADDVFVCAEKTDFSHGIGVAFVKIATDSFAACKAIPKFTIAAELQTFYNCIFSTWVELSVSAFQNIFPSLFGGL